MNITCWNCGVECYMSGSGTTRTNGGAEEIHLNKPYNRYECMPRVPVEALKPSEVPENTALYSAEFASFREAAARSITPEMRQRAVDDLNAVMFARPHPPGWPNL